MTTLKRRSIWYILTKSTLMSGAMSFHPLSASLLTVHRGKQWGEPSLPLTFLLPRVCCRPFSVRLDLLFEGLDRGFCRCHFHINRDIPPLVSGIAPELHDVDLQPCSGNSSFALPHIGPQVLCPDGDFITGSHHHPHLIPDLFVSDQSSQDVDVVLEDVDRDVILSWFHHCRLQFP